MEHVSQDALDAHTLSQRLQHLERTGYWMHLDAASPMDKYPAKQHARRVQEKLGAEAGLIFLPGASNQNIEDSDMPVRFRQRRYFYYLSGCNEPNCLLMYNLRTDVLTLFLPKYDPRRVLYYGPAPTKAEAMDRYDIDEARYVDELDAFIADWASHHQGSIYILHPTQRPRMSEIRVPVDSKALQPAMDLARVVKDHHEIKMIKKANDISSLAHRKVLAHIQKFKNEAQVEGLFLDVCVSNHAKEQAYDPIAASGPNAGTLHYAANNEDFGDRQVMCLDAGCEYELYASDITRTFPLSGSWPSTEAQEIYQLVERMQEACIKRLAPGVRYLDLHILAHQIAIDGLLKLGILHNGTREEIYKAGTSKAFFPHGLGHHVGLEVHDVGHADLMSMMRGGPMYEKASSVFPENFHLPVYDANTCMAPADPQSGHLEKGMVVTVEPGIYFSTFLLEHFYFPSPIHSKYINKAVVLKYLPVGGVRIEDDILITSRGYENLTTAPKGEAMLEIIRNGDAEWPLIQNSVDGGFTSSHKPVEEKRLVKAPGIARDSPGPIQVALNRVQTLPVEKNDRDTFDFEPFDGPSLYAGFGRASTVDNATERKASNANTDSRPHVNKPRMPVCGENSPEVEHTYMDMPGEAVSSSRRSTSGKRPLCKSCSVLVQTLERLRHNLSISDHGPPKSTFDGFGAKRMGIEPLRSASKTGPIDASARSRPQKGAWVQEPIPRNITASPVQMEAQKVSFNRESGPKMPNFTHSVISRNAGDLDISAGNSHKPIRVMPRNSASEHQKTITPETSQQRYPGMTVTETSRQKDHVTNWLASTTKPQTQSTSPVSPSLEYDEFSMPVSSDSSNGHDRRMPSSVPPKVFRWASKPIIPWTSALPIGFFDDPFLPRTTQNPQLYTEPRHRNVRPHTIHLPPQQQLAKAHDSQEPIERPQPNPRPRLSAHTPLYGESNLFSPMDVASFLPSLDKRDPDPAAPLQGVESRHPTEPQYLTPLEMQRMLEEQTEKLRLVHARIAERDAQERRSAIPAHHGPGIRQPGDRAGQHGAVEEQRYRHPLRILDEQNERRFVREREQQRRRERVAGAATMDTTAGAQCDRE